MFLSIPSWRILRWCVCVLCLYVNLPLGIDMELQKCKVNFPPVLKYLWFGSSLTDNRVIGQLTCDCCLCLCSIQPGLVLTGFIRSSAVFGCFVEFMGNLVGLSPNKVSPSFLTHSTPTSSPRHLLSPTTLLPPSTTVLKG